MVRIHLYHKVSKSDVLLSISGVSVPVADQSVDGALAVASLHRRRRRRAATAVNFTARFIPFAGDTAR